MRRTVGAIAVSICVVAITFLVLHGLAPELAHDTEPLPLALLHYLELDAYLDDQGIGATA